MPQSSPDLKLHVEYRAIILKKKRFLGANYDLQLGGFSFLILNVGPFDDRERTVVNIFSLDIG